MIKKVTKNHLGGMDFKPMPSTTFQINFFFTYKCWKSYSDYLKSNIPEPIIFWMTLQPETWFVSLKFLLFKIMTVPIGSFIYPQRIQISVLKLMIVWGLVKENANQWLPFWFGTHSSQIILAYVSARSQKHLFYNNSWGFFSKYFPSSYA